MKKSVLIFSVLTTLLFTSCAVSREAGERQYDEATIRQAVESRRFIVKLDRLYTWGTPVFLRPRSNYIIVNGEKALISTAYIGRQYDIRPIAGINMRGVATDYRINGKESRGTYQISMKVGNRASTFNVYLSVGKSGTVSASVSSLRIENTRYSGYIVPIGEPARQLQDEDMVMRSGE